MGPPLKLMPPTLTVVAKHDWMKDRATAFSEALRKVNVDAPVLEYNDAIHEFATLDSKDPSGSGPCRRHCHLV
ncbi:hypothetical protein REPUB_Repub05bG0154600 [Reevesia pubescens]